MWMVIVPIDAEVNKAQHIREKDRYKRPQGFEIGAVRYLELEHHYRDDDRDNGVAERLQACLVHIISVLGEHHSGRVILIKPSN
jgi:hypothetical protein